MIKGNGRSTGSQPIQARRPPDVKEIEKEIDAIRADKEAAIKAQDFEKAAALRDSEKQAKDKLAQDKQAQDKQAKGEQVKDKQAKGGPAEGKQIESAAK